MSTVIKFKYKPGLWTLTGKTQLPGPLNLESKDLKSFIPAVLQMSAIRNDTQYIKKADNAEIYGGHFPGSLKLLLENNKNQSFLTIKADLVYLISRGTIPFYFILLFIPLQYVIEPFSGLTQFFKSYGMNGLLLLTLIRYLFIVIVYVIAGILFRRKKLTQYKNVFNKIAAALVNFRTVYDRMPAEKKDAADFQPEYAELLPKEERGINLAQLCYQKKASCKIDINQSEIKHRLWRVVLDAGFENCTLKVKHYTIENDPLFHVKDDINIMFTPRNDHTQVDVWSYLSTGTPIKPIFTMIALLVIQMILFGYLYVQFFGMTGSTQRMIGVFMFISVVGPNVFWFIVSRIKIRNRKRKIETRLPKLIEILNAGKF